MKMAPFLLFFCFASAMVLVAQNSRAAEPKASVTEAEAFMKSAEARLAEIDVRNNQAGWVHENFITDDTEALAASASDQKTAATSELVEQAKRFERLQMPPELARKFLLLKLSLVAPGPKDP